MPKMRACVRVCVCVRVSRVQSAEYTQLSQTVPQTDRYCVNRQIASTSVREMFASVTVAKQQSCSSEEQNTPSSASLIRAKSCMETWRRCVGCWRVLDRSIEGPYVTPEEEKVERQPHASGEQTFRSLFFYGHMAAEVRRCCSCVQSFVFLIILMTYWCTLRVALRPSISAGSARWHNMCFHQQIPVRILNHHMRDHRRKCPNWKKKKVRC